MNIHNSSCVFWLVVLFDDNSVSLICFIVSGEYLSIFHILYIHMYIYHLMICREIMNFDISFNVFKAWASFSWIFCVCIWTNVDVKQKQTKNTIKTILLWYTSLRCWSHFLHSAKSDEYNHCFGLFFSDVNFVPRIFKGNWFCVIKTQRKGKKQTSMVYLKCDHIFLWKLISFFFLFFILSV